MTLTGLRLGELTSITVGHAALDASPAYLTLKAADEKSRRGAEIPIRDDLAIDLRKWLAAHLLSARLKAGRDGTPLPSRLDPTEPLLDVPTGLVRILDRDLAAAGIAKRDDRGRTVDVHALRTTFGTHLSKGGVPLRTAQAAMRHSKPDLTANVYTDPRLLGVHGALAALPGLSLDPPPREREKATGTFGEACPLVPVFVPTPDFPRKAGEGT